MFCYAADGYSCHMMMIKKIALKFYKRLKEEILNAFLNNKLHQASVQSMYSEKHIKKCFDPIPSFCNPDYSASRTSMNGF